MSTKLLQIVILSLGICLTPTPANSSNTTPLPDSTDSDTNQENLLAGTAVMTANFGSPLCSPTQVTYWVDISGCPGPYTITYSVNSITPLITTTVMTSPYIFTLNVSFSTTVILWSVTAPGCNITVTPYPQILTIIVQPPIKATIKSDVTICQGGNGADLMVGFTGNGPFTFSYRRNNVLQPSITTNTNPYILNVNPTATSVYTLNDVSNPSCTGTVSLQPVTVTVVPPPSASLVGDMSVCNQADSTLIVDFTGGSPPFQLVYAIDGVAQPPISTANDPYLLPVLTDSSTVFTLLSMQNTVCSGAVSGSATIEVLTSPVDTNVTIHCNPEDNNYTVEFDILGAVMPITLTIGSGTLNGTHFTSAPINQWLDYQFVLHDSIQCQNVTIAGPTRCFCVSDADSMAVSDTLSACTGDSITAVYVGPPTLDGDDAQLFLLHSNPGALAGQVFGWSKTPKFGFMPGMFTDTVYYISAIAGDSVGIDSIDLADICLSISPGVPIFFRATPTATPGSDVILCSGSTAVLTIALTGTPPYTLVYAINGVVQPFISNINANTFDLNLNLTDTSLMTFFHVSDQFCSAIWTDTVVVTVNYVPQIVNLDFTCNWFPATYTVSFEIAGGLPPYSIAGTPGTLTGTVFTSDPIASGQPYDFTLSDNNTCGISHVSDTITCPCATEAGDMDTNLIRLCSGDIVHALHDGTQVLDNSDILLFALHTGPGLGTILATSPTPDFSFDPMVMQFGVTYFVSALAGNTGTGVGVNLLDPCLSVSTGTPVVWNARPTATLAGNFDICPGVPQTLDIAFAGQMPYILEYTENGLLQSVQVMADNYVVNTALTQSSTFILVSASDANCPGTVDGMADITVHPIPLIANPVQTCDPDNLHYTVAFEVQQADLASVVISSLLTGVYDPTTGHFTSDAANLPNLFTFYVSDAWQCGIDTFLVVPDCPCVTDAGSMGLTLIKLCTGDVAHAQHDGAQVLDNTDVLQFVLHDGPGLGTLFATASTPDFSFDPALMQFGSTYFISAMAGNAGPAGGVDLSDACLSVATGTPVVWNAAPTASLNGSFDICPGEAQALDITFTGQAPFQLNYTENGVTKSVSANANNHSLNTTLSQSATFILVSVADGNCPGTVSGQADITVHPIPFISNLVQSCDPDNLHYTLEFDVEQADLATVVIDSPLAGVYDPTTGHFSSSQASLPNDYTFYVSDAWLCGVDTLVLVPDCPCITDAGTIGQAPMDICIGADIHFPVATGQVLDAFDNAQYVLCSDPANPMQSVLLRSATPAFAYSPLLQAGVTYYVVAVAGNPGLAGNPDVNDPCLSVSTAIPVAIHALPTAQVAGDTTLCSGSTYSIPVTLSGASPFTFLFTQNGIQKGPLVTNLSDYSIVVDSIQQQQVIQLLSVQDQYCAGQVSGMVTLNVLELPIATLSGSDSICPGGNALLYLSLINGLVCEFDLVGTSGTVKHIDNAANGSTVSVSPGQSTIYTMHNLQVFDNGCPPIANGSGKVDLAPVSVMAMAGDYNGEGISCFGADDGFANASFNGGFGFVSIQWSNNDQGLSVSSLSPGLYSVTATDLVGCTDVAEVMISEPGLLSATWSVRNPDCLPGSSGGFLLSTVQQGVGPYMLQWNNQPEIFIDTLPLLISNLSTGPIEVSITDANGCVFSQTDTIYPPNTLALDLGPDLKLFPGDSVQLTGIVTGNLPVSITWTPVEGLQTPNQLTTLAFPLQSTTYTLTIEDDAGCIASDDVKILLQKSRRIYLPNVIKPGSGRDNDVFIVYGGPEVRLVKTLSIFDRWGEHLFEARDILPNDPALGWDGTWRGKEMPPGVYVYYVQVLFRDGETELYKGDVTVVR